ncbi:MAG: glucokinase [Bacteroidota bacterium]
MLPNIVNGMAAAPVLLVADVGGTFARFSLARGGALLVEPQTRARSSAGSLAELCRQAWQDFGQAVDGVAIAVAAPVSGGRARMTNVGWEVDELTVATALSVERVLLINDFAALAYALPSLQPADLLPVPGFAGSTRMDAPPEAGRAPRVIFGPGTGLGVAALFQFAGRSVPVASEGGHIGFAPSTVFEQQVLAHAARLFEHVSWERILSGPGLELIDEVSQAQFAAPASRRTAAAIIAAAAGGQCAAAAQSIACFAGLLGSFGGDLALTFRAAGGVVIGGGVVARLAPLLSLPDIRQRFCRKGRFSSWLGALPLAILLDPYAALRGAALAFAEHYSGMTPPPVCR